MRGNILESIMERKENQASNREELLDQKSRIEEKIKNFDNKEKKERLSRVMFKLNDLSESITDMQNSLNIAWKRVQEIQEEIAEELNR